MITSSENGYITSDIFVEWFERGFLTHCCRERPVILIMDNHSSHLSHRLIKLAQENCVVLLCLPPHSTHLLQPLDVAYFNLLKRHMGDLAVGLGYCGMKTVPKHIFPKLLHHALNKISSNSVKSAFSTTGIYPLRPSAITSDQCQMSVTQNPPQPEQPDETCTACGRTKTNPLVKLGIIPAKFGDIMASPPCPPKKRQRKDKLEGARLIVSATDLRTTTTQCLDTSKDSTRSNIQPHTEEQDVIESFVIGSSDAPPNEYQADTSDHVSLSPIAGPSGFNVNQHGADTNPPLSSWSSVPDSTVSTSENCVSTYVTAPNVIDNESSDSQVVCAICFTNKYGHWTGCDFCPTWYHTNCLPKRECRVAQLSAQINSKWRCNQCLHE